MAVNLCSSFFSEIKDIFLRLDSLISKMSFKSFSVWLKDDGSYVTSIDLELQGIIIDLIKSSFPEHRIYSEENEQTYLTAVSSYTWIIDPIDGTNNLVAGKIEFGVSVGLMYEHSFIAAYVNFPIVQESYFSSFNSPVLKNWLKFDFPDCNNKKKEIILCSKTYPALKDKLERSEYDVVCYYCATYSMLKLLKGEALLYHTVRTNIYDIGPMSFVLKNLRIDSFNISFNPIEYSLDFNKIPFFIATCDKAYLNLFR
jgi:fructose-1,6-bisphosphatase/inositol monophosphatase family enzyme